MKDRIIKRLVINIPHIKRSGKLVYRKKVIKSCKQCPLCKVMPYLDDKEFYCYKSNRMLDDIETISIECPKLIK